MEQPADDASPARNESLGGVGGAPEASGWAGPSGGMGASGAMGGAGAGGPIGATDPALQSGDDATKGADPGAVKTEYEMGHEVDPRSSRSPRAARKGLGAGGASVERPDEDR